MAFWSHTWRQPVVLPDEPSIYVGNSASEPAPRYGFHCSAMRAGNWGSCYWSLLYLGMELSSRKILESVPLPSAGLEMAHPGPLWSRITWPSWGHYPPDIVVTFQGQSQKGQSTQNSGHSSVRPWLISKRVFQPNVFYYYPGANLRSGNRRVNLDHISPNSSRRHAWSRETSRLGGRGEMTH
jgi:hypothetical protein